MKKCLAILAALFLLAALCACAEDSEDVVVKNGLKTAIDGVYISPAEAEEWSEPLNYARLSPGSSIHIDFERFAGSGIYYDIGLTDEEGRNYDVYDVPLAIGDTLEITARGEDRAILTVTSTDGTVAVYDGYAYFYEDEMEAAG